jgi:hypothetical protein
MRLKVWTPTMPWKHPENFCCTEALRRSLDQIVIKNHPQILQEGQNCLLVFEQPIKQVADGSLFASASSLRRGHSMRMKVDEMRQAAEGFQSRLSSALIDVIAGESRRVPAMSIQSHLPATFRPVAS